MTEIRGYVFPGLKSETWGTRNDGRKQGIDPEAFQTA
jgi:hypothetical protein